jgi:ribosomal protein L7/L12
MKWYKLYLEAQIRGVISTAYAYTGPMRLRAFVVLALARRDAAANLLRSREEFYAELKRLSAVSSLTTVTVISKGSNSIAVMKALREIVFANQTKSFDSSLRMVKDIVDQVVASKPYTFKVRPQHRDAVVAKLRGAGATVE